MNSQITTLHPVPTINIVLTAAECDELAQLLDIAVKAGGLRVAAAAVKYLDYINTAITASKS
jgi:hypothetical protein